MYDYFGPKTLTFDSFAALWATRMYSISFENPEDGAIESRVKKSVNALSRYSISTQITPILLHKKALVP